MKRELPVQVLLYDVQPLWISLLLLQLLKDKKRKVNKYVYNKKSLYIKNESENRKNIFLSYYWLSKLRYTWLLSEYKNI